MSVNKGFGYGAGLAVGILVGLIAVVLLSKYMNKDGQTKTRYDEMQEKVRGRAYMYAFWTVAAFEILMVVIRSMEIPFPVDEMMVHLLPIFLGAGVHVGYSIWHHAYIGINNNKTRIGVVFVLIAAVNLLTAIISIVNGGMFVDGKFTAGLTNLLCGLLFVFIGVELFLRHMLDQKSGQEE